MLDLARVLMGEVERVYCETQSVRPGIAGEDAATITLRHRSGAVSLVDCSYAAKRDPDPFPEMLLEIEGRRGSLILSPGLELKVTSDGETVTRSLRTPLLGLDDRALARVAGERAQHAAALGRVPEGGREPETSGRDNLKTYALAEAAYQSAATYRAMPPAV